jgi:hypothetical protein
VIGTGLVAVWVGGAPMRSSSHDSFGEGALWGLTIGFSFNFFSGSGLTNHNTRGKYTWASGIAIRF